MVFLQPLHREVFKAFVSNARHRLAGLTVRDRPEPPRDPMRLGAAG
jgi:hypothetical protein